MDELERLREFRANVPEPDEARVENARATLQETIKGEDSQHPKRGGTGWTLKSILAGGAAAAALGAGAALLVLGSDGDRDGAVPLGRLFSGSGDADYEPAASPAELAESLGSYPGLNGDVVVRGTVAGFANGRIYTYPDDPPGMPTVVMDVTVDDTLQGDPPGDSSGHVYVELDTAPVSGNEAVAKPFQESVPNGTPILLYLAPTTESGPYPGTKIEDGGAGYPAGQPLFRVYTPQGLYLSDPEASEVIQPQEDTVFPGASLKDLEPTAEAFPPSEFDPSISMTSAKQ